MPHGQTLRFNFRSLADFGLRQVGACVEACFRRAWVRLGEFGSIVSRRGRLGRFDVRIRHSFFRKESGRWSSVFLAAESGARIGT